MGVVIIQACCPLTLAVAAAARGQMISCNRLEDTAMKKFAVCMVIGLFVAESIAQEPVKPIQPAIELQAMVKAAQRTYEANERAYEAENTTLDELYIWSRRWMQAATEAAATPPERFMASHAHRARMQLLLSRVSALHKTQQRGGEDQKYYAAMFYLAEADVWLKKAREAR
jgi:hypothetical protein